MTSHLRTQIFKLHSFCRYVAKRKLGQTSAASNLTIPQPDGQEKTYSPKIEKIFQSITELNLLEVAELNDLLKKRLNIPDSPVMNFGAVAAAPSPEIVEEEAPKNVKTSYTVKLIKYDEKQKVALIKELKSQMTDMNLVQAKKFIESAPAVIKQDIGKDEAEKLKEVLTKVGAEIVID